MSVHGDMGADIHLAVHARNPAGAWSGIPDTKLGPLWDRWRTSTLHQPRFAMSAFHRDYAMFARLMGTDRQGDIMPLFGGRNLPDDVAMADDDRLCPYRPSLPGSDALPSLAEHSFSWASFEELLAADWGARIEAEPRGFLLWLRSPEIEALVAEHGAANLRLLMGLSD